MSYQQKYIQKQLIGRGHYGKVYLAYSRSTNLPYACKTIQFTGMSAQQHKKTLSQVQIHRHLLHPNILSFKEYFLTQQSLTMIMDYCEFGDLSVYIKSRQESHQLLEEDLIVNLVVQMLFGINYLHERKVLHRDLKTQNVFVDAEGTLKIADFGISRMLDHTQQMASTIVGTPYYLSPQACANKGYSFKSDVWSLGCVLYELCTLQHPFQGDNILLLAKKISNEQPKDISSNYSKQLRNLISSMLRKSPQDRPSIKQILQSKLISQYIIKFKMSDQSHLADYPIYKTQTYLSSPQLQDNEFIDITQVAKKPIKQNNSASRVEVRSQGRISPTKGSTNLRQKCIEKMGEELFEEIYGFMRNAQSKNVNQHQIQQKIKSKYSKKQVQYSMDIAQLIYIQDIN